jgi:hypothetical protein
MQKLFFHIALIVALSGCQPKPSGKFDYTILNEASLINSLKINDSYGEVDCFIYKISKSIGESFNENKILILELENKYYDVIACIENEYETIGKSIINYDELIDKDIYYDKKIYVFENMAIFTVTSGWTYTYLIELESETVLKLYPCIFYSNNSAVVKKITQ